MTDYITTIREAFAGDIREYPRAIGFGFYLTTGRQIGVRVTRRGDRVRLSDNGETWSDLVMHGPYRMRPTPRQNALISRLCRQYGVMWHGCELVAEVAEGDIATAARSIISAAYALDGWRVVRSIKRGWR